MLPAVIGRKLKSPPSDRISNICFSNHSDNLLVSSWDNGVRLYDVNGNVLTRQLVHNSAVLDCCFCDDNNAFSASHDKTVKWLDLFHSSEYILGSHDDSATCVEYSYTTGQVISGSWDKTIKCWDPRQAPYLVATHAQPERVCSMSTVGNRLVVATAGRHVNVFDLRYMDYPEYQRMSPLEGQTGCVRAHPNWTGYAIGSVDGSAAMVYFEPQPIPTTSYEFKCHRKIEPGRETVYPVNSITFHPVYNSFATGGSDGFVNVWDVTKRNKLCQLPKYPTSIAALSFNRDGRLLAVASSYMHEQGDKPHGPNDIFVRTMSEAEVTYN